MVQLIHKSPLAGLTKGRKILVMIFFSIFIFLGVLSLFVKALFLKDLVLIAFALLMGNITLFASVYKNPLARSNKVADAILLEGIICLAIVVVLLIFFD